MELLSIVTGKIRFRIFRLLSNLVSNAKINLKRDKYDIKKQFNQYATLIAYLNPLIDYLFRYRQFNGSKNI